MRDQLELKEIYTQQYAHFGRMNDILYKMPPIFSTITGALWYFAANNINVDRYIASAVFLFTALAGLCFIVVLKRFALAFSRYIDNINKMDGEMKVTLRDSRWPSAIDAIITLVVVAVVMSIAGAVYSLCK